MCTDVTHSIECTFSPTEFLYFKNFIFLFFFEGWILSHLVTSSSEICNPTCTDKDLREADGTPESVYVVSSVLQRSPTFSCVRYIYFLDFDLKYIVIIRKQSKTVTLSSAFSSSMILTSGFSVAFAIQAYFYLLFSSQA